MTVYTEIAAFSGIKPAVYIGSASFSRLLLESFQNSLSASLGQTVAMAVQPYVVRFDSAVGQRTGTPADRLATEFSITSIPATGHFPASKDLYLTITEPMILTFSFGILDAGRLILLTTLTLTISNIRFQIDVMNNTLDAQPSDAQIVPSFARDLKYNTNVVTYRLDPDTTTRVEGMLLYSGLATAITKTVSSPQTISLTELFQSVQFQGVMNFDLSTDRQFLFINADRDVEMKPSCPCADVGNGIGPVGAGTTTPNPTANPTTGAPIGGITIGGPAKVDPTRPDILGPRRPGTGDSGFYLPNQMAQTIVQGPYPAIRLDITDNGFIGWKAAAIIDFASARFTPDPAFGRFYVELSFRVEVYGSLNVDLGKLGKIRITDFSAEQSGPGANSVNIGFYFVLGTGGIYIKPVLEDVDIGRFEIFLRLGTLIGTPFGTWGAVIGFIFDKILGLIISSQIPMHLDSELRKYMAKAMFTILSAQYAAKIIGYPASGLMALYDGGADGFLISSGRA
jgi:hypothetical protein